MSKTTFKIEGGGGALENEDLSFCLVNSGPFKGMR